MSISTDFNRWFNRHYSQYIEWKGVPSKRFRMIMRIGYNAGRRSERQQILELLQKQEKLTVTEFLKYMEQNK